MIKVAPVSADMLIKIAAVGVAGLVVLYLVNKAAGAVGSAAASAANAVNPLNNDNVIYQTANIVTGGSKDDTLGGRIYDWLHPDPLNTGGATGSW